ncbi:MAG TPA: hypothetical protein VH189_01825, partial [Rhizomicrobium sp.]|nr:hypothetical protein [Rhizomicrobium sp.]
FVLRSGMGASASQQKLQFLSLWLSLLALHLAIRFRARRHRPQGFDDSHSMGGGNAKLPRSRKVVKRVVFP